MEESTTRHVIVMAARPCRRDGVARRYGETKGLARLTPVQGNRILSLAQCGSVELDAEMGFDDTMHFGPSRLARHVPARKCAGNGKADAAIAANEASIGAAAWPSLKSRLTCEIRNPTGGKENAAHPLLYISPDHTA